MSTPDDERQGDELLKRLWQMPPKPHAKIKPKKNTRKKKPAKRRAK